MKIFFLSISICFGYIYVSAQKPENKGNVIKVTYEYHNIISGDKEGNYDTYLYINDTIAQFIEEREEKFYTHELLKIQVTTPFFKYVNNFNLLTGIVEENRVLKDSTRLYAKWENDLVWEITDQEKIIGGYTVVKAIAKSYEEEDPDDPFFKGRAIAWFAPDIPISVGPARYFGLPGLILELGYERLERPKYVLKSINFKHSDYQFVKLDKNTIVDDRLDLIYFHHKNPSKIREIQRNNKTKKKKSL